MIIYGFGPGGPLELGWKEPYPNILINNMMNKLVKAVIVDGTHCLQK